MNLNWGTILVGAVLSAVSAVGVWFVTNAPLGPWVERRKRLAADKLKHDMDLFPCGQCGDQGTVPRWFISRHVPNPNPRMFGYDICRRCDNLEPRLPYPYEDQKAYRANVTKEAKEAKKLSRVSGAGRPLP